MMLYKYREVNPPSVQTIFLILPGFGANNKYEHFEQYLGYDDIIKKKHGCT